MKDVGLQIIDTLLYYFGENKQTTNSTIREFMVEKLSSIIIEFNDELHIAIDNQIES